MAWIMSSYLLFIKITGEIYRIFVINQISNRKQFISIHFLQIAMHFSILAENVVAFYQIKIEHSKQVAIFYLCSIEYCLFLAWSIKVSLRIEE